MTHDIDWDDPAARGRLIERIGPAAYEAAQAAHHAASTVATIGGHAIRPVTSGRFGRIFMVGNKIGFTTLAKAEEYAREHPIT